MAKKNRSGKAWKDGYTVYKTTCRYEKNRKRRLSKHIADNPNDSSAASAITKIKYRRKTPKVKDGWTAAAFKNVDKKFRSENMVTKEQCRFWANANKMMKKTENQLRHMSKEQRELRSKENRSSQKQKKS